MNYVELVSGSRMHNGLLVGGEIRISGLVSVLVSELFMVSVLCVYGLLELVYILSSVSLFVSRLYMVGVLNKKLIIYLGLSGVIMRASGLLGMGKMVEYECYKLFNYYVFCGLGSDCVDRFVLRYNESVCSGMLVSS